MARFEVLDFSRWERNVRILYLDLDGVFANSENGIENITGFKYSENPEKSWSIVGKVDNFFLTLEPMPNAIEIFNEIVNRSKIPLTILTAMPILTNKLCTAEKDKRTWVAKYLSPYIKVICVSNWQYKKMHCVKNDILLDDSSRNILDWNSVGGIGILHTASSPWESLLTLKEFGVLK